MLQNLEVCLSQTIPGVVVTLETVSLVCVIFIDTDIVTI